MVVTRERSTTAALPEQQAMNDAVEAVGRHTALLPGFWSSAPLLLQCGCPGLAALLWLLALLQVALSEVATDERVAALIAP